MVYCTKCGAKNEEDARVCIKCGAALFFPRAYPPRRASREVEEKCFGVPWPWLVIFIGVVIILAGVISLVSQFYAIELEMWPIIAIVFGIFIIIAVLYRPKR